MFEKIKKLIKKDSKPERELDQNTKSLLKLKEDNEKILKELLKELEL